MKTELKAEFLKTAEVYGHEKIVYKAGSEEVYYWSRVEAGSYLMTKEKAKKSLIEKIAKDIKEGKPEPTYEAKKEMLASIVKKYTEDKRIVPIKLENKNG